MQRDKYCLIVRQNGHYNVFEYFSLKKAVSDYRYYSKLDSCACMLTKVVVNYGEGI